jgi:uncharacterized protein YdhG (YjbR/CyaY superfamily)
VHYPHRFCDNFSDEPNCTKTLRAPSLRNLFKVSHIEPFTKKQFGSVSEYLDTFPKETREILQKVRRTVVSAAPESVEAISYGIPTFKLDSKNLVHFAGWKNHIGFYPTPSATKKFGKELSRYKGGKGSLQFPLDEAIPFDLIRRIVVFRVQEIRAGVKAVAKKKR